MTRRKLLFLAYYYAPHHAVASIRSTNLARHLADLGWLVTVVTPSAGLIRQHDATLRATPDRPEALSIHPTAHRYRVLFPSALKCRNSGAFRLAGGIVRFAARHLGIEREAGWKQAAFDTADYLLRRGGFDVILSSGGPWLSHRLAAELSRRHRIPCVLDYRDLWCGNPYTEAHRSRKELHRERSVRAAATAITAVSPSILSVQAQLFQDNKEGTVITNGYDLKQVALAPAGTVSPIILLYAGQFYPPDRTFEPFVRAFTELKRRVPSRDIQLHYVGPSSTHVRQVLGAMAATQGIRCDERVPRAESIRRLQQCSVALVSASNKTFATPAEAGIITGKIFEIFAARKPYLAIAPQNSDLREIASTAGGGGVFTAHDHEDIVRYLESVLAGSPPAYLRPESYSWNNLARHMAAVLEQAASAKRG